MKTTLNLAFSTTSGSNFTCIIYPCVETYTAATLKVVTDAIIANSAGVNAYDFLELVSARYVTTNPL